MKRNIPNYSRVVAVMLIVISCSVATSSFAQSNKIAMAKPVAKKAVVAKGQDANQFIQQMMNDGLIDQVKGFVVEKKQNKLYIDGQLQTPEIADKYLRLVKEETVRIQVFSLQQRFNMHPTSNILQILTPVSFSSGCVDYGPKGKKGC